MFTSSAWFGYILAAFLIKQKPGERYGDVSPILIVSACAIAGALTGMAESHPLHLLGLSFVLVSLVALIRCDIRTHWTPPWLALAPLGCICAVAIFEHVYAVPISALLVSLPFASVALVTKGTGMSWSDVRVAALGTSLIGLFPAVIAYSAAGLLVAFVQWTLHRRTSVPLAPYLIGATAVAAIAFGG